MLKKSLALLAALSIATFACAADDKKEGKSYSTASGLEIQELKVGEGEAAKAGDEVTVNYTGWLTDGTKFDSSIGRAPFTFKLGAKEVIKGWDEGVAGMKPGGKRKLTIPSKLGYGEAEAGGGRIPANSTLIFEVELLKAKPAR